MEDHLIGSTTVWWVLLVIYGQLLFTIWKPAYPYTGLAYLVSLVGGLIFHIVGIIWIADEDCTDTDWYYLAVVNTVIFFIFFCIILIGTIIMFFVGKPKEETRVKPQKTSEHVEESEERMMPNEENKENAKNKGENTNGEKESNGEEAKEGETVDKDKNDKKDEEEDLEEEEIY